MGSGLAECADHRQSRAHHADYGLCLCRSDGDVPKHRGLSTIAAPMKGTPGITIQQTRAANGLPGRVLPGVL